MAVFRNRGVIATIVTAAALIIFIPLFFNRSSADFKSLAMLTLPSRPYSPSPAQLTGSINPSFALFFSPAHAWVLQVADFPSKFAAKESPEANALVQSLRKKGFKAYVREMPSTTGPVWRVFVGPEIKSVQIKALAEQLSKTTQLKSTITAFDPLLF